ncbi:hypothetical protein GGI25_006134 [Coemansia spiralis]|uniref:Uncharacterized protein n=2 Tax=Coemansia TaxID=4863 RepID=A0A9W8G2P7_9FUNG|nr:hypothetical protein BX070DRAFT_26396 [Coemansia spiralis]KAJ1986893.1 hypothetical protein EDC05_006102 [Coemansia umbellata]KAJ2618944.1 hypothetical protein GGI26_006229 [Coemansia sp. RSA 1358]KAJ2669487.1 hypothetical protein GGI25_006134 [Coemansia spiralis]
MPPGRPKRMRYTFANDSHRHARSFNQPVYAWKKVWATPKDAQVGDNHSSPYRTYKWVKTGQTVVHEDDEDGETQVNQEDSNSQMDATADTQGESNDQGGEEEAEDPQAKDEQLVPKDPAQISSDAAVDAAMAAMDDAAATTRYSASTAIAELAAEATPELIPEQSDDKPSSATENELKLAIE